MRLSKSTIAGLLLLLLPLGIGLLLTLPHYAHFVRPGGIVPVSELGIKGHVYFAYVQSGYTRNRIEQLQIRRLFGSEVTFSAAAEREAALEEEERAYEAELKDEALEYALYAVAAPDGEAEEAFAEAPDEASAEARLRQLIEETGDYYGDSFGLMLAIGLTEEREREDFSHRGQYVIAGTGTIEPGRQVGPVGGVREKVISAHKGGARYFLVPSMDLISPETGLTNREEAEKAASELQAPPRIVPVASLEEALSFLRALP